MTEPCDLTAVEARRLIGQRKLSPVELLESCLKRIGEVNHAVNAVVALDEDRARAAGRDRAWCRRRRSPAGGARPAARLARSPSHSGGGRSAPRVARR